MTVQPDDHDLSALEILTARALRNRTMLGEAFIAADTTSAPPREATVVDGDVVDPGIVYLCAPGRATAARLQLDRQGMKGGVIRESETVSGNQILAANRYILEDLFTDSLTRFAEELRTPRPNVSAADEMRIRSIFDPMWRDPYLLGLKASDPRDLFRIGGLV